MSVAAVVMKVIDCIQQRYTNDTSLIDYIVSSYLMQGL